MYCYKCGSKLGSGRFCTKCGFPTQIHFVKPPPKLRLRYSLTLPLFIISSIGAIAPEYLEQSLSLFELDLLLCLSWNLFAPLMVIGAVLVISTKLRNSLQFWLIDYITALGVMLFPIRHFISVYLGTSDVSLPVYVNSLILNGFWAMIVGGILAKKLLMREVELLNVKVTCSKNTFKLGVLSSILVPLFVFLTLPSLPSLAWALIVFACGFITWVVWNLTAVFISKVNVFRNLKGKSTEDRVVVKIGAEGSESGEEVGFTEIFIKSIIPTLLSFSLLAFLSEFVPSLGIDTSSPVAIFESYVNILYAAFAVLIFISPFVAPPSWLLDALDLRVYDRKKEVVEKASVIEVVDSFVDIFAFIGLIASVYQMGTTIALSCLKEVGEVSSIALASVIVASTVNAFAYIWFPMMAPALLATTFYYKYSFSKHVKKLLKDLSPVEIKIIIGK